MDRRRFLLTSLVCALAAPLAAEAQQAGKVWRIGVLFGGTPTVDMAGPKPRSAILRSFLEGLYELGYIEGQNVVIERRSAEGKTERLPDLFGELVRLKVDLILASGEQTTPALLGLTKTVPIVQPTLMDPVERGYVKSLARPGGNLTGLSLRVDPAISGRLLELLKEIGPHISRVAVLHKTAPAGVRPLATFLEAMAPAANRLQVTLLPTVVNREEEFHGAFAAIERQQAEGLIIEGNGINFRRARLIVDFTVKSRVPAAAGSREVAEAGGLMAYGPNVSANFRRAAIYVDKILKGTKPADLPIEQPTRFELVINLKAAKALGLTIPPSLLARADQVIDQ
jgi:putative tryptophan/tyrosine transport system substrate-binding protein